MKVTITLDGPESLVKQLIGTVHMEAVSQTFETDPTLEAVVMGEGVVKVAVEVVA